MLLILHFKQYPAETAEYFLFDGDGVEEHGQTVLAELAELVERLSCSEVRFIIPGELVTSLVATVPKGSAKQIDVALPYVVEELLASPVEQLHLARREIAADRRCLMLAIDRRVLDDYLGIANAVPLPLTGIFPDYLGLQPADAPQIATIENRTLIRNVDGTGLAIAGLNASTLLPESAVVVDGDQLVSQWWELSARSPNLLQGEYRPAHARTIAWQRPLAAGAAASVLLLIGYFLVAGWYFQHQANGLQEEATALYQTLFPDDKRIIDIRKQMQGHLVNTANGDGQQTFFRLLAGLAQSMSTLPDGALTPRHLQFSNSDNKLTAEIQAKSMNDTTSLKKALVELQLSADILSVTKNDAGVLTRLEVTLP